MAGMSSPKELLGTEGHYFSITVTRCLSVKASLAMCYKVNLSFHNTVAVVVLIYSITCSKFGNYRFVLEQS